MSEPQYRYNPKTLRYERVRFSIWRAGSTLTAYCGFGFLFFVGLNLLQNALVETQLEKSLAKENKALATYKTILATQLSASKAVLGELKGQEVQLTEKLFEVPAESAPPQPSHENHLVATGDAQFDEQALTIGKHLTELNERVKASNLFFGERLHLKRTEVPVLVNLPSIAPVADIDAENLVSGYGVRINPFHKGNYHHDGVDIAMSKGTLVLATGNGRISYFSNSNLEAGFGNYIEVDHGHGLITRYAHLEKISVTWGQKVTQGQVIGLSGTSGGSVAPHLHYEVIKNGKSVDPLSYLVEGITPALHQLLATKSKIQNQSLD
jgi:murein DD-endopeptidase MepM/ murein hydrolase activator NlpD